MSPCGKKTSTVLGKHNPSPYFWISITMANSIILFFLFWKVKQIPLGPLGKFVDMSIIGKYIDYFIVDNFDDFKYICTSAKLLNVPQPNCVVVAFDQEVSPYWCQYFGHIEPTPHPAICNTILQCFDDNSKFQVYQM